MLNYKIFICHLFLSKVLKIHQYSYYFSHYPQVGGWAFWKRAWEKVDLDMKNYPSLKKSKEFKKIYPGFLERKYMGHLLDGAYKKESGPDTQWLYSVIVNKGICILPNKNLLKREGFGGEAEHTKEEDSYLSLPTKRINFPLKHPAKIKRNRKKDEQYIRWLLSHKIKKYFFKLFKK